MCQDFQVTLTQMGGKVRPSMHDLRAVYQHDSRRDASQAFDLIHEPFAMVPVSCTRMRMLRQQGARARNNRRRSLGSERYRRSNVQKRLRTPSQITRAYCLVFGHKQMWPWPAQVERDCKCVCCETHTVFRASKFSRRDFEN
jgi:hypothetical protein